MAKKSKPNGQAGKPRRPSQRELLPVKDRALVRAAKRYADQMYVSDEALAQARVEKQLIHSRMHDRQSTHFTAHGYEFERAPGEERFVVHKIKRGAPQADTSPDAEAPKPAGDFEEHGAGADEQ